MKRTTITTPFYALGTLCLIYCIVAIALRYNPSRLSFVGYAPPKQTAQTRRTTQSSPNRLIIESASIDIPIMQTQTLDSLDVSINSAVHMQQSPTPGAYGNSIVFGHNWNSILGNLTSVRPGDTITVHLDNGSREHFEVQAIDEVANDAVEVLGPTADKRLTIYTCSGLFDQNRFVVSSVKI